MKHVFWYGILTTLVLLRSCQSSTLVFIVMEVKSTDDVPLVCEVPPTTKLTRWTYLSGRTGTSLMLYKNQECTVLPSDSIFSDRSRYSYTCNNTIYQVTVYFTNLGSLNNHILACRDAVQPDGSGFSWIIKIKAGNNCTYCEPTMTFHVQEITEGDDVIFICRVSYDVLSVNWKRNIGANANTAAMSGQNGQCTTSPPDNTFLDMKPGYIYTCNRTLYQVTRLNVQRSEHNDMYMCTSFGQTEGTGSNWIIKVKVSVTSVSLIPSGYQVNVKENIAVQLSCKTSTARPAASIYWYIHPNGNSNDITRITDNITTTTDYNDLSIITSTLHFVPTRQHNDLAIYCEANNSVNTSPVKSNKILLNVQYKAEHPFIAQGREYRVTESTPGTLYCTVKGGNPQPSLSWSCTKFLSTNQSTINSNGNTTKTLTWTPTKTHEGKCTCTSTQTNFKTETKDVSIVVLYPPSKPIFKVNGTSIFGNISFIEGTTRSLTCEADSKPSLDRYTWTGPSYIDSPNQSILALNNLEKKDAGEYGCSVHNTMNPSDGGPVNRSNNSTVNLVVLYNPVALPINNTSILKGEDLSIRCPYKPGMPSETMFVWTRNIDDKQWNGEQLNISHVEKNDAAKYSCNVSNVMTPSGTNAQIGQDFQIFYLNVLYKANVTSFTIGEIESTSVTKNESEPVPFICNVDSNPTATITLSHDNKSLKTELSNIVKHNISKAGCLDAGKYMCYAKNEYNTILSASEEVQLFVNCYPRTANEIHRIITSERNSTITITLNVIAYPPPTFTWYKLVDEKWMLLNDDDNYLLNSSAVQSNLTIRSVGENDFTNYKVLAKNDFGQMDQLYYLSPYDKPEPPINFTHMESRTTTSLIHLVWTPGFDNGPSQTFNIKYKKISDTVWKYISVTDNGETTMEIQLTGLTENTLYVFVIFASNVKGNSTELSITATTLKVIETNTRLSPAPLIGGIAGGFIGCSIIVLGIVFIVRRYPYCKVCSGKLARGKSDKTDDTSDEHDYYNTGSVSEYEMINRTNMEPTLYSSLNQRELGTQSDATNDDKKIIYENLKLQVF